MKKHCLIVDDNALVRETTAALVKHILGCPVRCCSSAAEAIRAYEAAPGEFGCVITDFNMPGMNGLELGNYLRIAAPGLKLVLVTGNPGALNGTDVRNCGFECVIEKPFNINELRDSLNTILPEGADFFVAKPTLNNSYTSRTHCLYESRVSFFERSGGMTRAVA